MSEQVPEQNRKFPVTVIIGIILAALCGISLYIRMAVPYDHIFVDGSVWFMGTDAWYHMRHIENIAHNFPHINSFDPYMLYPGGGNAPVRPLFDLLTAGIIWFVSLGSPTQHIIDTVGAYIPAILGTLTLIPVYFIGKELFNRWVGVIAAALLVILPGEFLNRTLLGFTDHHAAEALFSTIAMLFFILALKQARQRELSFRQFLNRDWAIITKPLVYTLLAGIFLGIYLLSWVGGLLIVFIIAIYLVIQFIVDHIRHKSTDYLCIIGTLISFIAFIMLLPILGTSRMDSVYRASLIIAVIMPVALSGISRLMTRKSVKPAYYPLALFGLIGIGFAALYAINPVLLNSMLGKLSIFGQSGARLTILEAHPLLFPGDKFSLQIAWFNFTTSFFISFIALGMLIYLTVKDKSADKTFFLVWSIIMLLAVLGQRRFSYYFAINAALLTGYFSWRVLDFAGLGKLLIKPKEVVTEVVKKTRKKKAMVKERRKKASQPKIIWARVVIAGVAIFFLIFFPNIDKAKALANQPPLIDQGWYSSLQWLKDNSPEPFDNPDYYYELYPPKRGYEYPETAYGVLSWWDYGYWIMRISHRIPNSNPGQAHAREAAHFFISQDENSANQLIDELGTKYVVIDYMMPTTKFYAMPEWAGKSKEEFLGIYYQPTEDGKMQAMTLFYPEYYRSMVVRLYNFKGKAVEPEETVVISYEEQISGEGTRYKKIVGSWSFPDYEAAEAYITSQESENYRIVSGNPFISPLPLEELSSYKPVHKSAAKVTVGDRRVPRVRIFKYLGPEGF